MNSMKERALEYHELNGRPGKTEVIATKPCFTADDLSLAYSPGVAFPVLEIDRDEEAAFRYTGKGNLVAVVSNGTAILGLGDRGALASKPVMEGKGVLFKRFADIDVFDIEVNEKDPRKLVEIVKTLEPTFGGINLEDIAAPECFEIERALIEACNIPIFHDDQHGTAIICTAGVINAAEITKRKLGEMKVVFNGAGAAGISCAKMFIEAGVKRSNIIMCDSKGVISADRKELSEEKKLFATDRSERSLAEAMRGADAFIGLSVADVLSPDMLLSMNDSPVVFAMANPDPEISYPLAKKTRDGVIMGTGRSDYPNQVNNVLGFPFIFRGAMDVRSRRISEGMKMAAARALAELAKEPIPDEVRRAYGQNFEFGPEYVVPKPFDPRVIEWEAVAVAKTACAESLATKPIKNWDSYAAGLRERMRKHWI
ncbi:NADP-dependent malic enzyme [Olavius algarvensis spirochete endosymbiont]|uniref:malic enzyme-like NAD(P)-binding protein n=1 Tax=Olavius algarvensis spirochete endosymbiont TaxID=260710 RepID=UPI000F10C218|nr:malic enzyme-like NAD(P)-binding protein [Olavius algarvensis spirochete endosymbiont]VDB00228.1 NADP-dependent malic enzyme [Olavius algarvensis spirochete endosymbiont]